MDKKEIKNIKSAITLIKQSNMSCAFTAKKKPTRRMVIMKGLLKFIRKEHMKSWGSCILDEDTNCFICDLNKVI